MPAREISSDSRPGAPGLFLVVCLALGLPVAFSARAPGTDGDRERLVAAVGPRRSFQGRPVGGFAFGPAMGRTRGGSARADVPFEVLQVSAELRRRFDADPTPMTTGNLALAYLLAGDAKRGLQLAELRALEEETPEALVDLSAAHLEAAADEGAMDQFPRAYDAALRALRKEPRRVEALFNRAAAASGMGLAWLARKAWDDYLVVDSSGPWSQMAREARSRFAEREAENDRAVLDRSRILSAWAASDIEAVREIAARSPELAREIVRREAIPAVALNRLQGRPLEPSLAVARELIAIAEAADGDTLDAEALSSLERGGLELAAAHIEFASASQALDDRRVEAGSPGVLRSAAVFKREGSPYAAQADLQVALADFFHGRRDGLIRRYTDLLSRYRGRYPLLRARALWMRALCQGLVASNSWQALVDRREAFAILNTAGQRHAARRLGAQLWTTLVQLGHEAEAGQVLATIMASSSLKRNGVQSHGTIAALTDYLRDQGLLVAAMEIRKQLAEASATIEPVSGMDAALGVVGLATRLGEAAEARRALEVARRALLLIDDRQVRSELEVAYGLAALEAAPLIGPSPGDDADRLVSSLRARSDRTNLRRALRAVGERRAAASDAGPAERALREALALHMAARSTVPGELERAREYEGAERAADGLVDLLSRTGRSDDALVLIEELRSPGAQVRPALARLQATLSSDEGAVSFWMTKGRIFADIVTSSGLRRVPLPASGAEVRRLIARLGASMDVESEALVARSLSDLHRVLLEPLEPALQSARRLIIVPDRELWQVPFAALAPLHGDPLIATHEVAFASSLVDLARPRPPWSEPKSVLAVGSPSWDRQQFGDMPSLPGSDQEAREVVGLYPRGRLLTGAPATKAALQRLAPGFEVIHVATHAVANESEPGDSFLLLSAEGSDPGAWRASEPGWKRLARARLIVLSACRTGGGRSRFGGGASLGVLKSIQRDSSAQVVVSTGDVEDSAAHRLLADFHRHILKGNEPPAALRLAQLGARPNASRTWMLYRVVL